jgi:hypothetical protein
MLRTHTRGQDPVARGQAHAVQHSATKRASSKRASTAGHAARSHHTAAGQGASSTTETTYKKRTVARRRTNGTVAPHRAAVSSSCSAEFGQCGGTTWPGPYCCTLPHRCYKQSGWYSQCGSACPEEASWACQAEPPSIGIIVARWGGWPSWMPLFLHTLRHNPTVDFHLLSDVPPPATAPLAPNVRYHAWSLEELLVRLRETVGVRLRRLHAGGVFASGVSSAKLNDFKPMFGEVFAEMLSPYEWWGHLQEDLLLGNLRRFASSAVLAAHDVLCPYVPPLNASGVLMLYRNVPRVNRAWRASSEAERVLSSPTYLVFDEWWGGLREKDNLAAVLGRQAEAGVLRLGLARPRSLWFGDDKRYVNLPTPRFNDALVACWRRGQLWQGAGGGCAGEPASEARQVAVLHLSLLKRHPALAAIPLDQTAVAARLAAAQEFMLTAQGLWLPLTTAAPAAAAVVEKVVEAEEAEEAEKAEGTAVLLASGKAPQAAMLVPRSALRKYMRALHAQDAAGRCNAKKMACRQTPPEAELPCVTRCNGNGGDAVRRGACSEAYAQLGMRACATRAAAARARAAAARATVAAAKVEATRATATRSRVAGAVPPASAEVRPESVEVRDPLPWAAWGRPGSDDTPVIRTSPRRADWNRIE